MDFRSSEVFGLFGGFIVEIPDFGWFRKEFEWTVGDEKNSGCKMCKFRLFCLKWRHYLGFEWPWEPHFFDTSNYGWLEKS